ncbi:MAG TPA: CocE/NonD family hydrolase [Candidatus Acidoferrum sp.]|nr:CocE/NonD family hydrolase [Candidatus Acidoferrum sp.]
MEFGNSKNVLKPLYKGFTNRSFYLTMRDGVKIAAELALPKNLQSRTKIPALLLQTRYWRSHDMPFPFKRFEPINEFLRVFTGYGYAIVIVDVRGTGASFGVWPHPWSKDEIMDGSKAVNWIVTQPWSNGKVGAIGTSYSGAAAEFLSVQNNPAVKAVAPRFSEFDVYTDIAFPGGVFNEWFIKHWANLDHLMDENNVKELLSEQNRLLKEVKDSLTNIRLPKAFSTEYRILRISRFLMKGVKPVDSDKGHQLLKRAVIEHRENGSVYQLAQEYVYRDDRRRLPSGEFNIDELSPFSFKSNIERSGVAIYGWGSWFDAGIADAVIRRFLTFSNFQLAVIGPWNHGGLYHASPYVPPETLTNPSLIAQWTECIRFFEHYLKGIANDEVTQKTLVYYTLGEERWKKTSVWPPEGSTLQRLYLAANNSLSRNPPETESGVDEYTVDFEATTGKTNRWHTQLGFIVVYRNRAEEDRRLLTYTSPPLEVDTEITGYPIVTLHITSTCTDGAFFVYLEDVDESGKVTYVTEGILRAIHRKVSGESPPYKQLIPYHSFKRKDSMALVPGETAELTFGLLPTSVSIKKGHCIRIAIAGHDKDNFIRIPSKESPVITVARNRDLASFIDLPIVQHV